MGGERHSVRAPDKLKFSPMVPTSLMSSQTITHPPETPPMLDPSSLRNARPTPNIREMIHGLGQSLADPQSPIADLLATPDPIAMYNFLQIGSPILRDFYPTRSPLPLATLSYEPTESFVERAERMSGARSEMNALFNYNNLDPYGGDLGCKSDMNQDGGTISAMSSPELRKITTADENGYTGFVAGKGTVSRCGAHSVTGTRETSKLDADSNRKCISQSSSRTRPPVDMDSSPPTSPEVTDKVATPISDVPSITDEHSKSTRITTGHNSKQSLGNAIGRRERTGKRAAKAVVISSGTSASVSPVTASYMRAPSPFTAAHTMVMNPLMAAGLMPFACALAPRMAQQSLQTRSVNCQGRPMAFVPGSHGTEFVPMGLLAQTSATLQYSAVQATENRMWNPIGLADGIPAQPVAATFEPFVGSRKKIRKQLLERSGCTAEQARQNRAQALKRLRRKKTLRTQKSTVRYACRKRIAMVRPRVNGRFATKEEVEECQRQRQR